MYGGYRLTRRWVVLKETQQLHLDPGTWHAVVKIIDRHIVIDDDLLQALGSFYVAAFVFLWLILGKGHDERRD